jgi:hypothetical protein
MDVEAGMPPQPFLHLFMLIGGVVVRDQVKVQLLWGAVVNEA